MDRYNHLLENNNAPAGITTRLLIKAAGKPAFAFLKQKIIMLLPGFEPRSSDRKSEMIGYP